MEQIVKAIEIWVPGARQPVLELGSAYYGDVGDFKRTGEAITFAYDQGLPGKTWASGRPIILPDIRSTDFQRTEAAMKANIVSGIALPFYSGEFLQAVAVLFFGGGRDVVGAMELWQTVRDSDTELRLVDGYYGDLDKFEWVSRRLTMKRGRGLPGSAWELGKPLIIEDLGQSGTFLRASHAEAAGITTGLAIPFDYTEPEVQILTLLSAKGTPIARRFEIWMPNEDRTRLQYDSGHCISGTDLALEYAGTAIIRGEGPLGQAWLTGRPSVVAIPAGEGQALIVLPIIKDASLASMVCLVL